MLLVLAGIAQSGERVGGLTRLRHEQREIARRKRRLAIAELRRYIDLDRQPGKTLEPVFADQPSIIGGAAGRNRNPVDGAEIERQRLRQFDPALGEVDVVGERMADHLGLLVDFLRHEVAVIAFIEQERRSAGADRRSRHGLAGGVPDAGAATPHDDAVAVLQIGNRAGERRQRNRVGAEIHLAVAVTDRERRTAPRADHKIVLAGEQESKREGAAKARQRGGDGGNRVRALAHLVGDQVGDHLGVGFGGEFGAASLKLAAQFREVLDDAVVHDRNPVGGVGMGIDFVGPAMGRPAGVAYAADAVEGLPGEPLFQVLELAFRAPAGQQTLLQRGDAGGIIAAIFKTLERLDQTERDRLPPQDSDDATHAVERPFYGNDGAKRGFNMKHKELT